MRQYDRFFVRRSRSCGRNVFSVAATIRNLYPFFSSSLERATRLFSAVIRPSLLILPVA
jgi:hypothetical protein